MRHKIRILLLSYVRGMCSLIMSILYLSAIQCQHNVACIVVDQAFIFSTQTLAITLVHVPSTVLRGREDC